MSNMQTLDDYYYAEQLKRYIIQFMTVFSGMKVKVGTSTGQDPRLIKVPIVYGSRDRVAAWIKGDGTQNKPLRLPTFSAYLRSIDLAPGRQKGIPTERRQTVARNSTKPFPENLEVVHQMMPVPYAATFELSIFASNTDQQFQIMEQILTLFDPLIQFQTSDDPLDWTQIITLQLRQIQNEENHPAGGDRRLIQQTLSFEAIIYMAAPAYIKENFIKNIKIRLGVVPTTLNLQNSEDVIEYFNTEELAYNEIFNLADVDIEGLT